MTGSVRVVGTAHVGERSRDKVREAIREETPDVVAVELDWRRYCSLRDSAERSGYGVDMMAAVREAEMQGIAVALIDRDVGVTLRRVWKASSMMERLRMGAWFVLALLGVGGVRDVDEVLDGGVEDYVERVRGVAPGAAEALIDERDAVMASRLVELREEGYSVVAVVGAGHENGVQDYLDDPESIPYVTTTAPADIYESGSGVVVQIDLPGCREDTLDVGLRDDVLVVEYWTEKLEGDYVVLGRGWRRSVGVSVHGCSGVENVSYSDGVLEVSLSRAGSIEVG